MGSPNIRPGQDFAGAGRGFLAWLLYGIAVLCALIALVVVLAVLPGQGGQSGSGDQTGNTMMFAFATAWLAPVAAGAMLLGWLLRTSWPSKAPGPSAPLDMRIMLGLLGLRSRMRSMLALCIGGAGVLLVLVPGWNITKVLSQTSRDPRMQGQLGGLAQGNLLLYAPIIGLAAILIVFAVRLGRGSHAAHASEPPNLQ